MTFIDKMIVCSETKQICTGPYLYRSPEAAAIHLGTGICGLCVKAGPIAARGAADFSLFGEASLFSESGGTELAARFPDGTIRVRTGVAKFEGKKSS